MRIKKILRRALTTTLGERRAGKIIRRWSSELAIRKAHRSPSVQRSAERFRALHNKHLGERCVIMGNGPSLRRTDLSLLKNEMTFGLNRIYLLFDDMGFEPDYFVCVNKHVLEQFSADISALKMPKFVSWRGHESLPDQEDLYWLVPVPFPHFAKDPARRGLWEGATVTYVAMQVAYYLGFREVILVGVDHSFSTTGPAHKLVTSEGADPNHFHPNYFGTGVHWQLPDLETSEMAYRMAKVAFEAAGGRIVDATVDGKLQVFEKMDLAAALRRPPLAATGTRDGAVDRP